LISDKGETNGAFAQANRLVYYATQCSESGANPIFRKYSNPGDWETVDRMFERLLGADNRGAAALSNIKVVAGDETEANVPSYLSGFDDPDSHLGLNEDAFVYGNRDDKADACDEWAEEGMTTDMNMIASVLLHEYTHWGWFL